MLENCTPIFTWPPARFVFVFQRKTVFISDSVKTEHRLLGAPGAKTKHALCQGVVFFRLYPREVTSFCLSLYAPFSCETSNNLGESMEIDALEGALVTAFSDRFPRFAAVHQRTQVPVSVRS